MDGHDHTYLGQQELFDKFNELVLQRDPEARELELGLYHLMRNLVDSCEQPADPEDRRIVIWFDN